MTKTLTHSQYITTDTITGFYGSTIPKGTILYPAFTKNESVKDGRISFYRFVFDTEPGATAHENPTFNKRTAIWFSQGKWDKAIKPHKK